jgi:hypothetical protein
LRQRFAAPSDVRTFADNRRSAVNSDDPAVPVTDPDDPPPVSPPEPDPADCCGEGCVRCIYDVHEDALERYQAALAAWRARHP